MRWIAARLGGERLALLPHMAQLLGLTQVDVAELGASATPGR